MRGLVLVVAAVLAVPACGGEAADVGAAAPSTAPVTATPARPSATPSQLTTRDLGAALRDAAISEEMHYGDAGAYTARLADLVRQGLEVPPGITVAVVSATAKRYCLSSTGDGATLYLDSDAGKVSTKPCR